MNKPLTIDARVMPAGVSVDGRAGVVPDDVRITCHLQEIPPVVEAQLEDLYSSLHSSLPYFRIFRQWREACCYVAWSGSRPAAILVFRFVGRRIEVLNEMIELDRSELRRFTEYIFGAFPSVDVISFRVVRADTGGLSFPVQRDMARQAYFIRLPDTPEKYHASIGKSTRQRIKWDLNRIRREYPSFECRYYTSEDMDDEVLGELFRLSELRISAKNYRFAYERENIIAMAKERGFVGVIMIDGRICAGAIGYRIGQNVFAETIGHDPAYDTYGLGILCFYLMICESIRRNATLFSMGGGRFDYKTRLGAQPVAADRVDIYRSHGRMARYPGTVAQVYLAGRIRRFKEWAHAHSSNKAVLMATRALARLQDMKDLLRKAG